MPEGDLASLDDQTVQRAYSILFGQVPDSDEEELLRDPRLLPLYVKLIEDEGRPPFPTDLQPDPETAAEIVRYAAHLVGELAAPDNNEAIASLTTALQHEKDRVKVGAASALGQLKAQSAVEPLLSVLDKLAQSADLGGVLRVAQALGQIGDERGKRKLQEFVAARQSAGDQQSQFVVAEVEKAIREIDDSIA